jgi:hypothetical protein
MVGWVTNFKENIMDKKQIIASIVECADYFDNNKQPNIATELTKIAVKLAQFNGEYEGSLRDGEPPLDFSWQRRVNKQPDFTNTIGTGKFPPAEGNRIPNDPRILGTFGDEITDPTALSSRDEDATLTSDPLADMSDAEFKSVLDAVNLENEKRNGSSMLSPAQEEDAQITRDNKRNWDSTWGNPDVE